MLDIPLVIKNGLVVQLPLGDGIIVGPAPNAASELIVSVSNSGDPANLGLYKFDTGQSGMAISIVRGRGTAAAPAAVHSNDFIYQFSGYGYATASVVKRAGYMEMAVDGTPTSTVIPGRFEFRTADVGGIFQNAVQIDSVQSLVPRCGFTLGGGITPGALANGSTTNDYNPVGGAFNLNTSTRVRQDTGLTSTITGLLAPTINTGSFSTIYGKRVTIYNISTTGTITLSNQDAGSAAANRFLLPASVNYAIGPLDSVTLVYDESNFWVVER